MADRNANRGMTVIEVLASTLLSAMLMVSVIGIMSGLRGHERALDLRDPTQSWQRSLAAILQRDLENAQSMQVSPRGLLLMGFGGPNWLPITVRYEVQQKEGQPWLVRTESATNLIVSRELVCAHIGLIRTSVGEPLEALEKENKTYDQPIVTGLVIQFGRADGTPIFEYLFRQT